METQEVMGMVEGNQFKLRSHLRKPGDQITYLFSGTMDGDKIVPGPFTLVNIKLPNSQPKVCIQMARKKVVIRWTATGS
ncbi:MAG: hypothetical protein IPF93_08340 [Saprospiraceae bacterium]|nr:hypothetical protein [Saprospiraceae bacterium]